MLYFEWLLWKNFVLRASIVFVHLIDIFKYKYGFGKNVSCAADNKFTDL